MKDRQRERKRKLKRGYFTLLRNVTVTALTLLVLFGVLWMLWPVQGQDMFPAARDGDLLLASRLQRVWHRGDIVIYQAERERRVGRIAAKGNDRVDRTEDGGLIVNGVLQDERGLEPLSSDRGDFPLEVPEGCIYIIGDNRNACRDSRDFGPVSARAVVGTVFGLLRIRGF